MIRIVAGCVAAALFVTQAIVVLLPPAAIFGGSAFFADAAAVLVPMGLASVAIAYAFGGVDGGRGSATQAIGGGTLTMPLEWPSGTWVPAFGSAPAGRWVVCAAEPVPCAAALPELLAAGSAIVIRTDVVDGRGVWVGFQAYGSTGAWIRFAGDGWGWALSWDHPDLAIYVSPAGRPAVILRRTP